MQNKLLKAAGVFSFAFMVAALFGFGLRWIFLASGPTGLACFHEPVQWFRYFEWAMISLAALLSPAAGWLVVRGIVSD